MPTTAEFIIERLENAGLKHVNAVLGDYPGDCIRPFLRKVGDSKKLKLVTSTDEGHAGFAADAYARANGIGCVCATYNVGALKLCNAVAGAYAEKSPVVVISGSPGMKERDEEFLLHHMVRSFENQLKIFKNITCAAVVLDDPATAGYRVDEALEKLRYHKQPVYIELPRDIAEKPLSYDVYRQGTPTAPETDRTTLQEALKEVFLWLDEAKRPVILAGVQLARFALGREVVRFAEKHNIPMATTLLGKSVVNEHHPLFLGVYAGSASRDEVRQYVEQSDCLLIFGEMLTDIALGFQRTRFQAGNTVSCSVEGLKIKNHTFKGVGFTDFCQSLFKAELQKHPAPSLPPPKYADKYEPHPDQRITMSRFFHKINSVLTEGTAVIADTNECLAGAFQLEVAHHHFISPAFYASMGFAVPGALGVQLAKPHVRPVVLVGDGAFQMTCAELSTIARMKLNPIVFVLNDGPPGWEYHKITDLIGAGRGTKAETEDQLEVAVRDALASNELHVINVVVDGGLSKRV